MPDSIMTNEQTAPLTSGVRRSAQWGDLMAALSKAQGEIEGAKKDSQNPHFKSNYADLASVMSAIREPLAKNGLAVTQWPRVIEGAVEIETIMTHGEQFISDVLWMPCSKMDAHGIGSAITYGRRYALMAAVGVAPEDDDGNSAVDGHKPGVPGMASGGGDFRPAGARRQSSWGPGGKQGAIDEARASGLLDETRAKGTLPNKTPDNAIKRVEWVKKAIEGFKTAQTKDELTQWWKTEAERLGVIETALPNEYERLLVAFDEAIERTAVRAA